VSGLGRVARQAHDRGISIDRPGGPAGAAPHSGDAHSEQFEYHFYIQRPPVHIVPHHANVPYSRLFSISLTSLENASHRFFDHSSKSGLPFMRSFSTSAEAGLPLQESAPMDSQCWWSNDRACAAVRISAFVHLSLLDFSLVRLGWKSDPSEATPSRGTAVFATRWPMQQHIEVISRYCDCT
jgi:hypothetical protein